MTTTTEEVPTRATDGQDRAQQPSGGDVQKLIATTAAKNPRLTHFWSVVVIALTVIGVLLSMNQVFFWNLGGLAILTNSYLYLLLACFLPIVFIVWPLHKTKDPESEGEDGAEAAGQAESSPTAQARPRTGVPWYDCLVVVATILTCGYFALNGVEIQEYGWEFIAPTTATVLSFVLWLVVLEALRRSSSWIVAALALALSLYPLIAEGIPFAILQGIPYDVTTLAQVHAMGPESILGLPMETVGSILIGFLLFGIVLQHTGGADFFHNLSMAIFGRYRGGSAKVSVASTATLGMMSGSAVSNVLTTGPMTIPAMKKSGFSARMAGAVEATASSGGSITPPIMGTVAFLMVSFVGVSYTEVLIAAIIPAVLYFLCIFIQIDGYAARQGLAGTSKELLPRVSAALLAGWPYIASLVVLTIMLFNAGSEAQVPYWIVGILLVIAFLKPGLSFGPRQFTTMLLDAGKTLGQIIGLIAGVGLILGGLSATGVALSLSRDLVALVGDNLILILIAGAVVCFVLGMGLTISAAYVFLAIVMVPAVTALGVDPIAAHLFVIYWASVSYITPPVGLAAFAAASISKASAMATCVTAMKLGAVKYIVPFGFALNPALVAQGTVTEVLTAFALSLIGVVAIASSINGWLPAVEHVLGWPARLMLGIGGALLFLPMLWAAVTGIGLVATAAATTYLSKRSATAPLTGAESANRTETDQEENI